MVAAPASCLAQPVKRSLRRVDDKDADGATRGAAELFAAVERAPGVGYPTWRGSEPEARAAGLVMRVWSLAKMNDTRRRLLEKKKRLKEQLAELERQDAEQKRKEDRQRAQLAGRAVLSYAAANPEFAAALRGILDASLSVKRDRELFDLGEKPAQSGPARPEIHVGLRRAGESG